MNTYCQVDIDKFLSSYYSVQNEFINEIHFNNCRNFIIFNNRSQLESSTDTVLFIEQFCDINGNYKCGIFYNNELCLYQLDIKNKNDSIIYFAKPCSSSTIEKMVSKLKNGELNELLQLGNSYLSPPTDMIITIFSNGNISTYIVSDFRLCF
jgi:hypothetical protein